MKPKGIYKYIKRDRDEKNLNTKQTRKCPLVLQGSPISATISEKVSSFSYLKLYQNYWNIRHCFVPGHKAAEGKLLANEMKPD